MECAPLFDDDIFSPEPVVIKKKNSDSDHKLSDKSNNSKKKVKPKNTTKKDVSVNTVISKSCKHNSTDIVHKEKNTFCVGDSGKERKDTGKERQNSVKRSRKSVPDIVVNTKKGDGTVGSDKSDKKRRSVSEKRSNCGVGKTTERTEKAERSVVVPVSESGTPVKRKKNRYDTIYTLPGNSAIEGKPRPVKDDSSVVQVIIDGEERIVSVWAIEDGKYIPGKDSELLVHCYCTDKKRR